VLGVQIVNGFDRLISVCFVKRCVNYNCSYQVCLFVTYFAVVFRVIELDDRTRMTDNVASNLF